MDQKKRPVAIFGRENSDKSKTKIKCGAVEEISPSD
jgi:hypothetical protein